MSGYVMIILEGKSHPDAEQRLTRPRKSRSVGENRRQMLGRSRIAPSSGRKVDRQLSFRGVASHVTTAPRPTEQAVQLFMLEVRTMEQTDIETVQAVKPHARILIVDDDALFRESLARNLVHIDFDIEEAGG